MNHQIFERKLRLELASEHTWFSLDIHPKEEHAPCTLSYYYYYDSSQPTLSAHEHDGIVLAGSACYVCVAARACGVVYLLKKRWALHSFTFTSLKVESKRVGGVGMDRFKRKKERKKAGSVAFCLFSKTRRRTEVASLILGKMNLVFLAVFFSFEELAKRRTYFCLLNNAALDDHHERR